MLRTSLLLVLLTLQVIPIAQSILTPKLKLHRARGDFRDFMIRLPARIGRKHYGQTVYLPPRMNLAFVLRDSTTTIASLEYFSGAVNRYIHNVDFYHLRQDSNWTAVQDDVTRAGRYDVLIMIPSEDDFTDKLIVKRIFMRSDSISSPTSLLLSSPSNFHSSFKHWQKLSAFFDFSVFWGQWSEPMLGAASSVPVPVPVPPVARRCVFVSSEDFVSTLLMNKLLYSIRLLFSLAKSVASELVVSLDDIHLLTLTSFISERPDSAPIYYKTLFGWEVLSAQQLQRDSALRLYSVLRVPTQHFPLPVTTHSSSEARDVLSGLGSDRDVWSLPCEARKSGGTYFLRTLELSEICPGRDRPITVHPDLLLSHRFRPYLAADAPYFVVQVWREGEGGWRRVLDHVALNYRTTMIERFYLGIQLSQLFGRLSRPAIPQTVGLKLQFEIENLIWVPPLGEVFAADFNLRVSGADQVVEIAAVNPETKELIVRATGSADYSVASYGDLPDISLDIREGDNLALIGDNYAFKYSLDRDVASVVAQIEIDDIGSNAAVYSRRSTQLSWLHNRSYYADPGRRYASRASHFDPPLLGLKEGETFRCEASRLAEVFNVSGVRCDVDTVRNGSHFHRQSGSEDDSWYDLDTEASRGGPDGEGPGNVGGRDDVLTVGMTTCRRLSHFLSVARDVESFIFSYSSAFVVKVIVIDDGSSAADREAMLMSFPHFMFLFKNNLSRGHAVSMNIMMRYVSSRFFMYLEDDWKLFQNPILSPPLARAVELHEIKQGLNLTHSQSVLHELVRISIGIIKESLVFRGDKFIHEPIFQVFFNDQRSKECAVGLVKSALEVNVSDTLSKGCDVKDVGRGGWYREIAHPRAAASINNDDDDYDSLSAKNESLGQEIMSAIIPYSLHEFGLVYESQNGRLHGQSLWPGSGFNPAVWDLSQLRYAWSCYLHCRRDVLSGIPLYSDHMHLKNNGQNHVFDEFDEAFEGLFSLQTFVAGLNIAYLPAEVFLHIGGDISAYILNNFVRPWE